VVFLAEQYTDDGRRTFVRKTKALSVRGPVVVMWARHLVHRWRENGVAIQPNERLLETLAAHQGVPQSLVDSAVFARNDRELEQMTAAFVRPRTAGHQPTHMQRAMRAAAEGDGAQPAGAGDAAASPHPAADDEDVAAQVRAWV
jgi:hypothetical protein